MPYRKHSRYITNEQFADGTTIDGSRIDSALQDVQEVVNSIPKGDLKNRYTQTQFVMGWSPSRHYLPNQADTSLPWMQAMNDDAQLATVTGGLSTPPESYQNPQRAKGYATIGIDPLTQEATAGRINGAQYIWSTPIHFSKSVIVQSLKVFFMLDTIAAPLAPYHNSYTFATAPEGAVAGPTSDVSVQMIIDRPKAYGSEDRKLNQVLANKVGFNVVNAKINAATNAPTADMFPNPYPGGNLDGKYFNVTVNEPIPSGSRLRIAIVIPDYEATSASSSWGSTPWLGQYYSVTLTVLEELER
jgi:hypothetical protein